MTNPHIERELTIHRHLRERLREEFPEADDDALHDTLDGLTNLQDQLAGLVRSALEDESLVEALRLRMADMKERATRITHRATVKRQLVCQTMERAEIRRLERPDFTASHRPGQPTLVVTEESLIPSDYWKPQPPKLDRQGLIASLKNGEAVPGACLGNGQPTISVRTK